MLEYIFYAIIFICIFLLCFLLIKYIQQNNILNVVANNIKESTNNSSQQRISKERENYKKYGNSTNINFFTKIDIALEMSDLKRKFPFLNTELLLLLIGASAVGAGVIVFILFGSSLPLILIAAGGVVFAYYVVIYLMVAKNARIVDDSIVQLANLLYSYSNVNSDIITVLDNVSAQLQNPLRTAINTCVSEARFDGDISGAFGRMCLKMRHRKLTEMMQAIEEGSKNNANYSQIIGRCYDSIIIYKGEKEVRRAMANGARVNIMLMLLILVVAIVIILFMLNLSFIDFFFGSTGGKVMFSLCAIVFFYVFYKMITLGNK